MVENTILLEEPKSKEIPLTRGYVAVVDAEDYERLDAYSWRVFRPKNGSLFYACTGGGHGKPTIFMHRLLLGLVRGDPMVDHRDHDGLNNRRGNLRLASHSQNGLNSRMNSRNTSGYRGVTWDKARGKWKAHAKFGYTHMNLGRFDRVEDAARAYDEAVAEKNLEFAQLNFPKENNA